MKLFFTRVILKHCSHSLHCNLIIFNKKKQLQISVRERSILIEFSVMFRVVFKDAYTGVLSLSSA